MAPSELSRQILTGSRIKWAYNSRRPVFRMELEGGDDDAGDNHSEVAFGEVDEALNDFGNA